MKLICAITAIVMGVLVLLHVGTASVETGVGLIAAGAGFIVP